MIRVASSKNLCKKLQTRNMSTSICRKNIKNADSNCKQTKFNANHQYTSFMNDPLASSQNNASTNF